MNDRNSDPKYLYDLFKEMQALDTNRVNHPQYHHKQGCCLEKSLLALRERSLEMTKQVHLLHHHHACHQLKYEVAPVKDSWVRKLLNTDTIIILLQISTW